MTTLSEVILRVRAAAPTVGRRVGGTAAFTAANQAGANIDLPHAFVVPMSEQAADTTNMGTAQKVTERFAVIVAVSNSVDPRHGEGKTAIDMVKTIRNELFASLLGWEPTPASDTFKYVRGFHLDMNKERYWHQFEFQFSYYIGPDCAPEDALTVAKLKQLFIGFAPEIGAAHIADYIDILYGVNNTVTVFYPAGISPPRDGMESILFDGRAVNFEVIPR